MVRKSNLWPKEALHSYKNDLLEVMKKDKTIFKNIFSNPFFDEDDSSLFYLQFGGNKKKGINALYEFNLKGELLKVLYVKYKRPMPFTRFEIKKGNQFYATADNKIIIYQGGLK